MFTCAMVALLFGVSTWHCLVRMLHFYIAVQDLKWLVVCSRLATQAEAKNRNEMRKKTAGDAGAALLDCVLIQHFVLEQRPRTRVETKCEVRVSFQVLLSTMKQPSSLAKRS